MDTCQTIEHVLGYTFNKFYLHILYFSLNQYQYNFNKFPNTSKIVGSVDLSF